MMDLKAQLAYHTRELERHYQGLPGWRLARLEYIGLCWAEGKGEPTEADIEAAIGPKPAKRQWMAFNATPETAPVEQGDYWMVADGIRTVEGTFTPRHAEAIATALNGRDLVKALGISLGLKVTKVGPSLERA